jgi:outer membrane protein assembly factor BamB
VNGALTRGEFQGPSYIAIHRSSKQEQEPNMTQKTCTVIVMLITALQTLPLAIGEDWPQWMGKNRDNRWQASNIIDKFPAGGPKVVWRSPVAGGYAGPAVVGNRLYVADFVSDANAKTDNFNRASLVGSERILCLDASNGKEIWKHQYPVTYAISYPAGPRCTPVVDDGKVYTLGAEGMLICLDAATGKIAWQKDLPKEYSTKSALWGYAAHPLIDGPRLICLVGGEGSHTVAFDKQTGKELWRFGTATEQGYSPPTIIQAAGVRQLILANPNAVNAVVPETGKLLWTTPYEATNGSIIMSPVLVGDYLFIGGYSNHNLLLKLDRVKPGATEVSKDKAKKFISPVNVQPFVDGDTIYGMDQKGDMVAFKLPDGDHLWTNTDVVGGRSQGSETAFLVKHRDRFFMFNEKGELVIAKLSPKGVEVIDRAKVIEPTNSAFGRQVVWCPPAFAGTRMYVRNDSECICVELSK